MKPASLTPFDAFQLAVSEARKGAGFVAPNPQVGCVILDRYFHLLSVGYHTQCGKAHAEVEALNKISDPHLLEGAHVFVTLEPCAHEGRTGSCAKRLAPLPIASVAYGLEDPNPLVAGQGAAILRAAGKAVLNLQTTDGVGLTQFYQAWASPEWTHRLANELSLLPNIQWAVEEVAEVFLHNFRARMPFVALKVATSLDGQMALRSGESKWITSELARQEVHRLRAIYDATLVGQRTWSVDDPSLNVRHPDFVNHQNRVVIVDPQAKSLAGLVQSQLWKTHQPDQVFLIVDEKTPMPKVPFHHQNWIAVRRNEDGALDLRAAMSLLFQNQVTSVFVEGGAQTLSFFLKQKLAQRVYLFQAPILLGAGLGWTSGLELGSMAEKIQLQHPTVTPFAPDWLISARIETPQAFQN